MKGIIFLPILVGIGGSLLFPYRLKGKAFNEDHDPIKGMVVYHFRTGMQTQTNADGYFELAGVRPFDSVQIGSAPYKTIIALANERGRLVVKLKKG